MYKSIFFYFISVFGVVCSQLSGEMVSFPNEFYITQSMFSWTTTFEIEGKEETLGTVHRKWFSWPVKYHLTTANNEVVAKAEMRLWSLLASFDITDNNGVSLGSVNEKYWWFFPTFSLLSPESKTLAEAELNFWQNSWTITDPEDGHTMATLSRPFFTRKNSWKVNICDPFSMSEKKIHPLMFLTLLAYEADRKYMEYVQKTPTSKRLSEEFKVTRGRSTLPRIYQEELAHELDYHRERFKGVEPIEEDFLYVESLAQTHEATNHYSSSEERYYGLVSALLAHLSSEHLSQQEKAALCLMLESILVPSQSYRF